QLGELERSMLVQALERTGGNRTNAAKLLRMTLRSLRYRLAKYGLGEEPASTFDDAEDA
ncbi:MAG TPA: helix-turn-helix domain-containing protein, partial [Polyangiales bacterium]